MTVRMVRPEEIARWDKMMQEHHYLGVQPSVGETLRHVAEIEGQWVALLSWGTAALKLAPRDGWIGWTKEQQYKRLKYIANNVRFLILPGHQLKNLASRVLSLSTRRLWDDWQAVHGHPVVLAETFVDPSRFLGTCYKAAGWDVLGKTRGFGRHGRQWEQHERPKLIFVRPLKRLARSC